MVTCEIEHWNNFKIISVFHFTSEIISKLFQRHWTCWKTFMSCKNPLKWFWNNFISHVTTASVPTWKGIQRSPVLISSTLGILYPSQSTCIICRYCLINMWFVWYTRSRTRRSSGSCSHWQSAQLIANMDNRRYRRDTFCGWSAD